jgi:RNA ligase (TIGR02306 family)
MSRKLATITKIKEIFSIEGADFIEAVTMTTNSWVCVVKKGDFAPGDFGVYFEIDSFLPQEKRYAFLDGKSNKIMNDVEGYRLRTIKLKKQISQGLILPLSQFPEIVEPHEGDDVTELLKIELYEPQDNRPDYKQFTRGCSMCPFPPFIRKTDQERIQSFDEIRLKALNGRMYEVTEKLDGTSVTIYYIDGQFGVCSRNYEVARITHESWFQRIIRWLKETSCGWGFKRRSGISKSIYEDMSMRYKLQETLPALCKELGIDLAVQGEIVGQKVSSNRLKLDFVDFYVFDIFNINAQEYLDVKQRYEIVSRLGLQHVPIINREYVLNLEVTPIEKLVEMADGVSILSDNPREGLVYKSRGDSEHVSFKTISNNYLLKHSL